MLKTVEGTIFNKNIATQGANPRRVILEIGNKQTRQFVHY